MFRKTPRNRRPVTATVLSLLVFVIVLPFAVKAEENLPTPPEPLEPLTEQEVLRIGERIAGLESKDLEDREKAEKTLQAFGLRALPLLWKALCEATDPEFVRRLRRLVQPLAWFDVDRSLWRPVSFQVKDQPLRQAVKELGLTEDRSAMLVHLLGPAADKRLTLKVKDMPGNSALNCIMRLAGLDPVSVRAVDVRDRSYDVADTGLTAESFVYLLKNDERFKYRGTDAKAHQGRLRVIHDEGTQRAVQAMLAHFRKNKDQLYVEAFPADRRWQDAIRKELNQKVSYKFVNKRLDKAIALLQERTDAPLLIAPNFRSPGAVPVSLECTDTSLKSVINRLAKRVHMSCVVRDHAVWIIKGKRALPPPKDTFTAVYNLAFFNPHPSCRITAVDFADLIQRHVASQSWDPNSKTSIKVAGNRLLVSQTPEVHDQVLAFVKRFRDYFAQIKRLEPDDRPPAAPLPPGRMPVCRGWGTPKPSPLQAGMRKRLQATTASCDLVRKPHDEVLAWLSSQSTVNIVIDPWVADAGAAKLPITLRLANVSMENTLRWVLRLAGLDSALRSTGVFVSLPKWTRGTATHKVLHIYYCRDLMGGIGIPKLAQILRDWSPVRDFDEDTTYVKERCGLLYVMHRPEVHEKIQFLLEAFRQPNARQRAKGDAPVDLLGVLAQRSDWEENRAIRAKLNEKVTLSVKEAAVHEVVQQLRLKTGASIVVDPMVFKRGPPPLTLSVRDQTLEETLRMIAVQTGIDFVIRDQAVFLSLDTAPTRHMSLSMFDVSELLDKDTSPEALVARLQAAVEPGKWKAPAWLGIHCGKLLVHHSPDRGDKVRAWIAAQRPRPSK